MLEIIISLLLYIIIMYLTMRSLIFIYDLDNIDDFYDTV